MSILGVHAIACYSCQRDLVCIGLAQAACHLHKGAWAAGRTCWSAGAKQCSMLPTSLEHRYIYGLPCGAPGRGREADPHRKGCGLCSRIEAAESGQLQCAAGSDGLRSLIRLTMVHQAMQVHPVCTPARLLSFSLPRCMSPVLWVREVKPWPQQTYLPSAGSDLPMHFQPCWGQEER